MSENGKCEFLNTSEIKPAYPEIVTAYQKAFSGWPWYEVSKCEDPKRRCVGGFCKLAIGEFCKDCNSIIKKPAYESDELVERFESIAASRPTSWYTESNEAGVTLAAIAWEEKTSTIFNEKYADNPNMNSWLESTFSDRKIIWLDEVFANTDLKPTGNLRNFGKMCTGFMESLNNPILAFRTINPSMTRAAERDFGDSAMVFKRQTDELPDRRDFVIIAMENQINNTIEDK